MNINLNKSDSSETVFVYLGNVEMVKLLLKHGANASGQSLLHTALRSGIEYFQSDDGVLLIIKQILLL